MFSFVLTLNFWFVDLGLLVCVLDDLGSLIDFVGCLKCFGVCLVWVALLGLV